MELYKNINLAPLGYGVILKPIEVRESLITGSGISLKADIKKTQEFIWKGECEVIKVGPEVSDLKPGDKVYMNLSTSHKLPFEHKGEKYLWTLAQAVFAKIT